MTYLIILGCSRFRVCMWLSYLFSANLPSLWRTAILLLLFITLQISCLSYHQCLLLFVVSCTWPFSGLEHILYVYKFSTKPSSHSRWSPVAIPPLWANLSSKSLLADSHHKGIYSEAPKILTSPQRRNSSPVLFSRISLLLRSLLGTVIHQFNKVK